MANLKSAKKKARQDIKRTQKNNSYSSKVDMVLRSFAKSKGEGFDVNKAFATIDKATKRGIFSKQKAARLKSSVSSKKK